MESIEQAAPFNPLPAGATHPVPVCLHFGYNTMDRPVDEWEKAPKGLR